MSEAGPVYSSDGYTTGDVDEPKFSIRSSYLSLNDT